MSNSAWNLFKFCCKASIEYQVDISKTFSLVNLKKLGARVNLINILVGCRGCGVLQIDQLLFFPEVWTRKSETKWKWKCNVEICTPFYVTNESLAERFETYPIHFWLFNWRVPALMNMWQSRAGQSDANPIDSAMSVWRKNILTIFLWVGCQLLQ